MSGTTEAAVGGRGGTEVARKGWQGVDLHRYLPNTEAC